MMLLALLLLIQLLSSPGSHYHFLLNHTHTLLWKSTTPYPPRNTSYITADCYPSLSTMSTHSLPLGSLSSFSVLASQRLLLAKPVLIQTDIHTGFPIAGLIQAILCLRPRVAESTGTCHFTLLTIFKCILCIHPLSAPLCISMLMLLPTKHKLS